MSGMSKHDRRRQNPTTTVKEGHETYWDRLNGVLVSCNSPTRSLHSQKLSDIGGGRGGGGRNRRIEDEKGIDDSLFDYTVQTPYDLKEQNIKEWNLLKIGLNLLETRI